MSARDPAPPSPGAPSSSGHPGESWFSRFKSRIRRGSGSLRTNLSEVLANGEPGRTDLSPTERTMLQNILTLKERRIGDLMVPRADIVAVQKDISLGELLKVFAGAGHSRLVVYNETLDDPNGMVHIRDIVAYLTERAAIPFEQNASRPEPLPAGIDTQAVDLSETLSAAKIVRHLLYVPASMPAVDLLVKMQTTRTHLALVIDEYGGTDGLVSMEDIVEQIVGEIEDEHDDEPASIVPQGDGSFIANARASLDEAREIIGPDFTVAEETEEEVDTLGGLMVTIAGRVPVRGEILQGPDSYEIEVLDADPRRVKRLRIYHRPRRESRRRRPGEDAAPPADSATGSAAGKPAG
jgi:CBS domain containing-hemolysin-like protein